MKELVQNARCRINAAARSAALSAAGLVFCAIGAGFLTVALWQTLAMAFGGLLATLICGLIYLVAGGVLLYIARKTDSALPGSKTGKPASEPEPDETDVLFRVARGFAAGMQAGRAARQDPQ